jgi:hypothetical protein
MDAKEAVEIALQIFLGEQKSERLRGTGKRPLTWAAFKVFLPA